MTAFDTGGPQGPPPTSPSEKSGSGGAGVDLDRLAAVARSFVDAKPGYVWSNERMLAHDVLALVERVRVLEDALREIADGLENEHQPEPFLGIARAALGGGA